MALRDYWRVAVRRWKIIVVTLILALSLGGLITSRMTPEYSSTARMFVSTRVSDTTQAYQGGLFASQRVSSYADLVKSRSLAVSVAEKIGFDNPEKLQKYVTATVVQDTVNLQITARATTPEFAQTIAQAYAVKLSRKIKRLETPSGEKQPLIKATIYDDATLNPTAVSPNVPRNMALAGVLGLLLGFGLAVVREITDNTLKDTDVAAELSGAPVLAAITFDADTVKHPLVTSLDTHAPRVEAFRIMRTNIQFVEVDSPSKVFVITSAGPGEGKTTTSTNLALTLAQAGEKVILVEADLRRPKVGSVLGVDDAVGLTSVLVGKVDLTDAVQQTSEGLHVLPSGALPPNPAELLQSQAMIDTINELRARYDLVLLDSPPLLPVTDAALLAAQSDGALLVVRHGHTTREQLVHSVDRLKAVGARAIGVVINCVPARGRRYGYGYGSYGYGYGPEADQPKRGRRARAKAAGVKSEAATGDATSTESTAV